MQDFTVEGGTLTLQMDLEAHHADIFRQQCRELLKQGDLVVDMTGLSYISSYTVGQLVAAHFAARDAGHKLTLRLPEKLLRIFELTNLTSYLSLEVQK